MRSKTWRLSGALGFGLFVLHFGSGRAEAADGTPQATASERATTAEPAGDAAQPEQAPAPRKRKGSEFWLPMGSLFLPGLGQYVQGAPLAGLGFTATAAGGYTLGFLALDSEEDDPGEDLPRSFSQQAAVFGFQLGADTGFVSAYDSFHRSLPALKERGRYGFLDVREPTGRLLLAPFEMGHLKRPRTLVPLALTAALAGILVASERDEAKEFLPFRAHDGLFALGVSYNAGVSEEAYFRGYLFALLHQRLGRRFWLSNGLQALVFGAGHVSAGSPVPWPQMLFGYYQGIVTHKNRGSIRESIFQHFWYDVIVITATFLADEDRRPVQFSVRVRF
jgi:membrane protease YdiL (CAAX protease family)